MIYNNNYYQIQNPWQSTTPQKKKKARLILQILFGASPGLHTSLQKGARLRFKQRKQSLDKSLEEDNDSDDCLTEWCSPWHNDQTKISCTCQESNKNPLLYTLQPGHYADSAIQTNDVAENFANFAFKSNPEVRSSRYDMAWTSDKEMNEQLNCLQEQVARVY